MSATAITVLWTILCLALALRVTLTIRARLYRPSLTDPTALQSHMDEVHDWNVFIDGKAPSAMLAFKAKDLLHEWADRHPRQRFPLPLTEAHEESITMSWGDKSTKWLELTIWDDDSKWLYHNPDANVKQEHLEIDAGFWRRLREFV